MVDNKERETFLYSLKFVHVRPSNLAVFDKGIVGLLSWPITIRSKKLDWAEPLKLLT